MSSPGSKRPRRPRRQRKVRFRTAVIAGSGVVALVGSLVLSQMETAHWLGGNDAGAVDEGEGVRLLQADGETPAEAAVRGLARSATPTGFDVSRADTSVSDPWGLTCIDGVVAWSAARTRTLSGPAEGAVTVLAYPAGGGGAAVQQVKRAAGSCGAKVDEIDLGFDSISYTLGNSRVVVLRRGDVVAVTSVTPAARIPDDAWFTEFDDRISQTLRPVCLDQAAPAADALRNPLIDPESFTGNLVSESVPFPDVEVTKAEEVTNDPVVPLGAAPLPLPTAPLRPEPLDPPAPDLPVLPVEVAVPVTPVAPEEPDLRGRVLRAVADAEGPGCGWEFTGQQAPSFDSEAAERVYESDVEAERTRLVDEAVAFEQAKVVYFREWLTYTQQVADFTAYATELNEVVGEWDVVVQARAEFVRAFEQYRASVEAAEAFVEEQQSAQESYDAAVSACFDLEELFEPSTNCPAPRPAILDQTAPQPLPVPQPSPLAQLPQGWEPPVVPQPEPQSPQPRPRSGEGRDRVQEREAG